MTKKKTKPTSEEIPQTVDEQPTETTQETEDSADIAEASEESTASDTTDADALTDEAVVDELTVDDEVVDDASTIDGSAAQEDDNEPDELSVEEQLALVRNEAQQNLESWQRAAAELANFKRRQEEQFKLQRDRIKSDVLHGVISALDDMNLAFQNLPEELDGQVVGWVEGFRLVQRKLDKILDDQNVMPIDTKGQFDPNFHEAVSYEDNDEHDTDHIIAELRKGYQIGSRVIRPALVRVAK